MVWEPIYDELLVATDIPITPVELRLSTSRLVILAECETAPTSWDLALRLKQVITYPDIGAVVATKQAILLGVTTQLDLAPTEAPYLLRLEVPLWMPSLRLQIWAEDLFSSLPVGFMMSFGGTPTTNTIAAFGSLWLQLTDDATRSIGSLGSGADIAESWVQRIFIHLWETYPTRTEVRTLENFPSERGAMALEDWTALKRLTLPDFRGSTFVGAGNTIPSGILIGSNTVPIAIANMPSHNHPGSTNASTGSHSHTGTAASAGGHAHAGSSIGNGGNHAHTASSSPGTAHNHGLAIDAAGNHNHGIGQLIVNAPTTGSAGRVTTAAPSSLFSDVAGTHAHTGNVGYEAGHAHAVSVAAIGDHSHAAAIAAQADHAHTLSVGTAANHTHTPAIAAQGSGTPLSVMQLSAVEHLFISCGVAA